MDQPANPIAVALDVAEARIATLQNALALARREAQELRAERDRYKARCYPSGADLRASGVTQAKLERWLDEHATRLEPRDRYEKHWPRWRDYTGGVEHVATWRVDDEAKAFAEMANTLESIADGRDLDQWALLDELARMEVG